MSLELLGPIVFGIVLVLFVVMAVVFFFKGGLVEVNPFEATVVKNIWTGTTRSLSSGTHQVVPGWEEAIGTATLKNEPSDPPVVQVITKDAVDIGIDYIIETQRVVDSVKAVTTIDYSQRSSLIEIRIRGYLQFEMKKYSAEEDLIEVVTENGGQPSNPPKTRKRANLAIAGSIEDGVNSSLEKIKDEWGIEVVIKIQNLVLPQKLTEVAEEAATAEREGQRIKDKATAAGVSPSLMAIGDIASDIVRALRGGRS